MKRCPECRRDYFDETLLYCLDDGSALLDGPASNEPETAILADLPSEAPTKPQISASRRRIDKRLLAVPLLVAILTFGGFLGYRYFTSGGARQINSIAVMPFANDSGNPEFDYLSDGMTETLIASLSQLPNLNVKARSSVFRYKGKETDAAAIGKELSVQAILNGRVVQRGDGITLYLELVDAQTGNRIWGDQYNRKQTDLISLQNDIARDVADKLKVKLSGADQQKLAKNYTQNPEAYQMYLKGRFHWNRRSFKDVEKSIEYFQQAIAIDPNYAKAYAGLADAYADPALGNPNRSAVLDWKSKARGAALKALSLDDNLAEAHTSLGTLLIFLDYDFAGAEREYRRAIEINPNDADAHYWYAILLNTLGRWEEAFAEHRRSLEFDPLNVLYQAVYGGSLVLSRRYDEAIAHLEKTLEADENFLPTLGILANAYKFKGDYAKSLELRTRERDLNGDPQGAALMRDAFAKGGWEGYLRFMTGENRPAYVTFYTLAVCHTGLGEKDKAFAALNKSYENREGYMPHLKIDPSLDPLRDDPRFWELLRKVGFPE